MGEPGGCNEGSCLSTPVTSRRATFLAGLSDQSSPDVTLGTYVKGRTESHEIPCRREGSGEGFKSGLPKLITQKMVTSSFHPH